MNTENTSPPKDVKTAGTKEFRVFKREKGIEKKISSFRFFPDQRLCFKQNGIDWTNEDYSNGYETCKRITERAFNGSKGEIIVRGTMVRTFLGELGIKPPERPDPKIDQNIELLKSGKKIVLMG